MDCETAFAVARAAASKARSMMTGSLPSDRKGLGVDVVDYREYSPGDDVRYVDWKATSRKPWTPAPNPVVRVYAAERSLDSVVILDASRSMWYGGKVRTALYTASLGATALSSMGDRVQAVVYGCGKVAAMRGGGNIAAAFLAKVVCGCRPGSAELRLPRGRRRLILLATDYGYPVDDFRQVAMEAAASGDAMLPVLHTFHLEINPPPGAYVGVDPEKEGFLDPSGVAEHAARVEAVLASAGYPPIVIVGDVSREAPRVVTSLIHRRMVVYR